MSKFSASLRRPEPESVQALPAKSAGWPTDLKGAMVFAWIALIHLTAVVGLILYPLPGWPLLLGAIGLTFLAGAGATICYHRALAHRSLELHPAVQALLIFFTMLGGVTPPGEWIPNHRFHHANTDAESDPSSPVWRGLWSSHVAWFWEAGTSIDAKYSADLHAFSVEIWERLLAPMFLLAFFGGAFAGPRAFFWLGAIRLVFTFHANSFVNSICHTQPDTVPGEDSSRNVWWVSFWLLGLGENWHRNHHTSPSSARIGWGWRQLDLGYLLILALEKAGLATDVRHFRRNR